MRSAINFLSIKKLERSLSDCVDFVNSVLGNNCWIFNKPQVCKIQSVFSQQGKTMTKISDTICDVETCDAL